MSQDISESTISEILQALASEKGTRREAGAKRAGREQVKDARLVSKLQTLAVSDPVKYVRDAAGKALGALGAPVPPLVVDLPTPMPWFLIIPWVFYVLSLCIWLWLSLGATNEFNDVGGRPSQNFYSVAWLICSYPLFVLVWCAAAWVLYTRKKRDLALLVNLIPILNFLFWCVAVSYGSQR